jgi:hypothetical protein
LGGDVVLKGCKKRRSLSSLPLRREEKEDGDRKVEDKHGARQGEEGNMLKCVFA